MTGFVVMTPQILTGVILVFLLLLGSLVMVRYAFKVTRNPGDRDLLKFYIHVSIGLLFVWCVLVAALVIYT